MRKPSLDPSYSLGYLGLILVMALSRTLVPQKKLLSLYSHAQGKPLIVASFKTVMYAQFHPRLATQHSGSMGQADPVLGPSHASDLKDQILSSLDFQPSTALSSKVVEDSCDRCRPVGLGSSPGCPISAGDLVKRRKFAFSTTILISVLEWLSLQHRTPLFQGQQFH